jgi:hypothetical protein
MRHLLLALAVLAGCSRAPITTSDARVSADSQVFRRDSQLLPRVDGGPPQVDGLPVSWGDKWDLSCSPGQRMWCDGLDYDGWGQVDCDPATGEWRTKINDAGQTVLDCRDALSAGRRPNTPCACYHFFFNPACCERPDCLVPDGTTGQICPPSDGALCSYCNPQSATDCKEPGAICIITNSHETFCGRLCDTTPCPEGYSCMKLKLSGNKTTQQCVPADLSCYY